MLFYQSGSHQIPVELHIPKTAITIPFFFRTKECGTNLLEFHWPCAARFKFCWRVCGWRPYGQLFHRRTCALCFFNVFKLLEFLLNQVNVSLINSIYFFLRHINWNWWKFPFLTETRKLCMTRVPVDYVPESLRRIFVFKIHNFSLWY